MSVRQETPRWTCALRVRPPIGEAPMWSDGRLYWIDLFAPSFNRFDPATGENSKWDLPEMIGTYALTPDKDRVLVALKAGLHELNLANGAVRLLAAGPFDAAHYR